MKKHDQPDIAVLVKDIVSLKQDICELKKHLLPVGTVQVFATDKAPEGWMVCDGKEVLISRYKELYEAVGNRFGGSVEKKTFCLPDLRGMFVRGWDMDGDVDPERGLGSYQEDALQGHGHKIKKEDIQLTCSEEGRHYHRIGYNNSSVRQSNSFYSTSYYDTVKDYSDSYKTGTKSTEYDGTHKHNIKLTINDPLLREPQAGLYGIVKCDTETRPKNVALLYCIKVI